MPFRNYFEGRPKGTLIIMYAFYLIGIIVILSTIMSISFSWVRLWYSALFGRTRIDWDSICIQPPVLKPDTKFQEASIFLDQHYKDYSAGLLSGAVQIPTESYDDMAQNPREDSRFDVFKDFHLYLRSKFPRLSSFSETVNAYGLLYTIVGSDPSLAPVVLMAHQDVVPVDRSTSDQWTHGPFSGHFDGEYIWGRGSFDTKSSLMAIFEATEKLLSQEWTPKRTVLISLGFDEELDGSRGALHLADTIRKRYGETDSVYMIIDEGSNVTTEEGTNFAYISVTEKGYSDINLIVNTPGGHSSNPPEHTGIGIMSEILTRLENTHTASMVYDLKSDDVVASQLACVAKYGADLSKSKRSDLLDLDFLQKSLVSDRTTRNLIRTSQAIDVIKGGVKVNALPEQVHASINYRIDVHGSVDRVTRRVQKITEEVGRLFGLNVSVNGHHTLTKASNFAGSIEIANGQSIEPAPVSPYNADDEHWQLLAGTTLHTLQKWFDLKNVVVAPALSIGNTDTWRYLGLTNNVYRYTIGLPNSGHNAHTVNERISLDSHLANVVWYYETLQFL